ncbi:transglutaminase family protein [Ancylothrix sp. C2]|uniref:transglutaminase family protein n=1 Tax=Ancylothrix sp. D3o TaxID=2953691 RepID=UPI0021BA5776|nr:transglutaminase family protein [Ancylothrix sp. D3o]MCT7951418.1 transglutaminase family protein [Ancylothrix sp. D3o]
MTKVVLRHETRYQYDRPVRLGPHFVRLRPAPHCPLPISGYLLKILGVEHSLHWLQDPYGNFQARVTFAEPTNELNIEVELGAEIRPVNPFNFFVEAYADKYPFSYDSALEKELGLFLECTESGDLLLEYLDKFVKKDVYITDFLCSLNQNLREVVDYSARLEEGIQTCEETLAKKVGSCRDTTWLLVQMLRHYGLAARFVSGYLIQLVSESSPDGVKKDSADLHAWAEVYLPGAGWIGLDPTSALLTAEGHIPLACTATPERAAPVSGSREVSDCRLDFSLQVSRLNM